MSCKVKGLKCLHREQPELNGEQCQCCDYKVRYLCAGMLLCLIQEVQVLYNEYLFYTMWPYRSQFILINRISMICNVCMLKSCRASIFFLLLDLLGNTNWYPTHQLETSWFFTAASSITNTAIPTSPATTTEPVVEPEDAPAGVWTGWINNMNPYGEGQKGDLEITKNMDPVSSNWFWIFFMDGMPEACLCLDFFD